MTTAAGVATMGTHIFDTLKNSKKLQTSGMPEKQAEAIVEMMVETVDDKLATKRDLELTKNELNFKIEAIKNELLFKLGSMLIGSVLGGLGLLVILMKLLKL